MNKSVKDNLKIFTSFTFIYLIFSELILSPNKYLPKIALIYEFYFGDLNKINSGSLIVNSISIVVLSLFIGLILVRVFIPVIILFGVKLDIYKKMFVLKFSVSLLFFYIYLTEIISPNYLIILIVLSLISLMLLSKIIMDNFNNIENEYILAAKGIHCSKQKLTVVYWKIVSPFIYSNLASILVYLFLVLTAFEFINNYDGIGYLFRTFILYNDFVSIASLFIGISVIYFISVQLINLISDNYIQDGKEQ